MVLILLALFPAGACGHGEKHRSVAIGAPDPERGKELIDKYGCTSCHMIPGVEGPKGMVGPSLDHIAARQLIAGKLRNTPENMTKWLQNPQALDPQNTMPNLAVTRADSRDIAAYLYTLH